MRRVSAAALAIAALLAISMPARAQGLPLKLLVLPSPRNPESFRGDDNAHLAYELLLANFTPQEIRIDSLVLSGLNKGFESSGAWAMPFPADKLRVMFTAIGADPHKAQEPLLKPSEAGVIFVFLNAPGPGQWDNILTIEVPGKPETRQQGSVKSEVAGQKPVVIRSPLQGKNWWTPNGPSNDSIHRRVIIALGDHLGLPERFAVDWVKLGEDGKTYSGGESDNRSYQAYNADVTAAADGKVVATKDGIAENVPNSGKMAVPITMETIGGNFVMEDIGNGRYAFYAHLIPGSLTVKPGEQVRAGQLLGKLGNSGNSTEPHLHFHICDGPNPLFCNGLPFEIDHFTRYDYKMEMKGDVPVKFEIGAPHPETDEIFMNEDLGEFSAQTN